MVTAVSLTSRFGRVKLDLCAVVLMDVGVDCCIYTCGLRAIYCQRQLTVTIIRVSLTWCCSLSAFVEFNIPTKLRVGIKSGMEYSDQDCIWIEWNPEQNGSSVTTNIIAWSLVHFSH